MLYLWDKLVLGIKNLMRLPILTFISKKVEILSVMELKSYLNQRVKVFYQRLQKLKKLKNYHQPLL